MLTTAMLLGGCKLLPTVTETRTEFVEVPRSLHPECPEMYYEGNTIGDMLEYTPELFEAYELCRSDVNVLIDYLESR